MRNRGLALRDKLFKGNGAKSGLGRWLILGWVGTTLGFLAATAFWRGELFSALDRLSKDLAALGWQGQLIFGSLMFLTTIPPLPLYSTLIVLSGYTFGVWQGFVVSYLASLIGAVVVFVVSRGWLKDVIASSLSMSPTVASLLSIIPQSPHLLLLIRIAPYPYNLLNVLLASSPLSLRMYTGCTALSLCKLVLHTWIGAGIHDLSEAYHAPPQQLDGPPTEHSDQPDAPNGWHSRPTGGANGAEGHHWWHRPGSPTAGGGGHPDGSWREYPDHYWNPDPQREDAQFYSTVIGIALCVGLFFYLTHLAKRALERARLEQEREAESGTGGVVLAMGSAEV